MQIVAGLSLKGIKPRVWDANSPYHLSELQAVMVSYADFVRMPAGVGHVFVTLLESVYLVDDTPSGLLWGRTYFLYCYNILPKNVIDLLGLPQPVYFFHILRENFEYQGGTYVFGPAYANFGAIGIIVSAILLGFVVALAHNNFHSPIYLKQAIALVIVALFARAVWYEAIMVAKPVLAMACFSFLSRACFLSKRAYASSYGQPRLLC